jgi:hypothetical protein
VRRHGRGHSVKRYVGWARQRAKAGDSFPSGRAGAGPRQEVIRENRAGPR